jgi:hypothetical protein
MHDGRSPVRIGILGAARIAPKRFPSRPTYAYQLGAFAAVLRAEGCG